MATSNYREDFLGRDLVDPSGTVKDFIGRVAASTTDYMGRPLRRILRQNNTAYTQGTEIQFSGGSKYIVKTGGTSAGSPPSVPALGADVADGGATLTRTK